MLIVNSNIGSTFPDLKRYSGGGGKMSDCVSSLGCNLCSISSNSLHRTYFNAREILGIEYLGCGDFVSILYYASALVRISMG